MGLQKIVNNCLVWQFPTCTTTYKILRTVFFKYLFITIKVQTDYFFLLSAVSYVASHQTKPFISQQSELLWPHLQELFIGSSTEEAIQLLNRLFICWEIGNISKGKQAEEKTLFFLAECELGSGVEANVQSHPGQLVSHAHKDEKRICPGKRR